MYVYMFAHVWLHTLRQAHTQTLACIYILCIVICKHTCTNMKVYTLIKAHVGACAHLSTNSCLPAHHPHEGGLGYWRLRGLVAKPSRSRRKSVLAWKQHLQAIQLKARSKDHSYGMTAATLRNRGFASQNLLPGGAPPSLPPPGSLFWVESSLSPTGAGFHPLPSCTCADHAESRGSTSGFTACQ